jgi:hypothetical protein
MAHTNGHVEPITATIAQRELAGRNARPGSALVIILLAIVALLGLGALVMKIMSGPEPYSKWGYAAATLAFLASTFQATPLVAFATRLAKGYWAVPLRRAAELGALTGLVTVPLHIVILNQLPDFANRPSIWFDWALLPTFWRGPYFWDSLMMIILTLDGLAILWLSSRPDFAVSTSRSTVRGWGSGWLGTGLQWNALTAGLVVLGAFYLMVFVFVHLYLVSDLAISLVPGWHSAIISTYHGVSSLQGGIATAILVGGALRHFGGLQRYIGRDVFWGASKLLLGTSLLFFYFTWAEFLTNWYGRTAEEVFLLDLLMWGPYRALFLISFTMNFILPLALLIWNPIRVSVNGPIWVAGIVFVGNLVDRIRIYVASWSVAAPVGTHYVLAPPAVLPQVGDIFIIVGAVAAVLVLYLLYLRVAPPIALWEYKSGLLLKVEQPYMKTEVAVVAKPR